MRSLNKNIHLGIFAAALLFMGVIIFPLMLEAASDPVLSIEQSVTDEPLIGGNVTYGIIVSNGSEAFVTDKGYNLTITDTLPIGLTYIAASPDPTSVGAQEDGSTLIVWDNITDLEYNESLELSVYASIDESLLVSDQFSNSVSAVVNTVPDNSGSWVNASSDLLTSPQSIDIEMSPIQSTADEQATGAGEYDGGADWPYQYRVTVKNNNVGSTDSVVAQVTLPAGVAYMGMSTGSDPALSLQTDGSLILTWSLGTLTTAEYATPIEMIVDVAIPYQYRTSGDTAAESGPFAGPMSGNIIPEDDVMQASYEATGTYTGLSTSDGTQSTPADDSTADVTAEYITVSKGVTPEIVGIGTEVTYTLSYYVSEYYTSTNVVLTDVLPDGMTYVDGTASLTPASVSVDTPGDGETTIVWNVPAVNTTPGNSGNVTFRATVDATYDAAAYAGLPIVSGDSLTNIVDMTSAWADIVTSGRSATGIPDQSEATVTTRMPEFVKEVWDADTGQWADSANGFVGDVMTFRLQYTAAADVDAKDIVIRDFLPRGMSFVAASDSYTKSGTFSDGLACTSAPETAVVDYLNGLEYVEWRLCNTTQGSTWEVTLDAIVTDSSDVQADWIVANFGKLSGQNTVDQAYSLRDIANVDYEAPYLVVTKTASPNSDLIGGDSVNYTITVENQGESEAYNIVVTDYVPADLIVTNSGGSALPYASSYTATSGNPAAAEGGTLEWSTIDTINVGETVTFSYSAQIPDGLPAGMALNNVATAAYNSRPDNGGRQTAGSTDINDANSDDETVYLRGLTITKSSDVAFATIGDRVVWTLDVTVPAGLIGYWPVVEENNLPNGFDYVVGTTVVTGATLDTTNHPTNPFDSGDRDLRWYLQTIDNSASSTAYNFTIEFETLVTGVRGNDVNNVNYINNCCLQNADNDAYIGWYDDATGYNNQGYAFYGNSVTNIDRRSQEADADVKIRQPNLYISKQTVPTYIGAGGIYTYTIEISNLGNDIAHDILLTDTLPAGLTYLTTQSLSVAYPDGFPDVGADYTDSNSVGATDLEYGLNRLYVGGTWQVIYVVQVDAGISANLTLENVATVAEYSSQEGVPPDTNSDGLNDERVYIGPSAIKSVYTPSGSIAKASHVEDELTLGSTAIFTLTVPSAPLDVWMYNVVVTDVVDSRLEIVNVTNGSAVSQTVNAAFASIAPGTQETIVIETTVPQSSTAVDGDLIENVATLSYSNQADQESNLVAHTFVTPALVVTKAADAYTINLGDTIAYTVTVQNVGQGRAENITVTDTLPVNMSYLGGETGSWSIASLASGQSQSFTYTAQAAEADAGVAYINTVVATGDDSNGQPIPADNNSRVTWDSDETDSAEAIVYGPLTCTADTMYVAYEDLKNVGWADWDYNDVVVSMEIEECVTPADEVAMVTVNYEILARGAGYDHDFRHEMPFTGGGQYYLTVKDENGVVDRYVVDNFDIADFSVYPRTKEALPEQQGLAGGFYTNTLPDQNYVVVGHSAELVVLNADASSNPAAFILAQPWDPYLYVHNTSEEVHLVIPGHLTDNIQTVNGIYDPENPMIGHTLPLAQTFEPGWQWTVEFVGLWNGYPSYETYLNSGGTQATDWASNGDALWLWSGSGRQNSFVDLMRRTVEATSRYYGSPAVADMNNDGRLQVALGNLVSNQIEMYDVNGELIWAQPVGGGVKSTVTLADLDNSGDLEMIFGTSSGQIYVYHDNGFWMSGWPVLLDHYRVLAQPAVADLDGDERLEVIVPLANGRLYARNWDGTARWDVSIGDEAEQFGNQIINSSPVIADINGDDELEIIVGSYDGHMYAFDADGNELWKFATGDAILSTPAVADFDGNSANGLEVAFGSGDSYAYLVDSAGSLVWQKPTGWIVQGSPAAIDVDGDQKLDIVMGSGSKWVFAWDGSGSWIEGWPKQTAADISSTPITANVDADDDLEILVGADDGRIYAWNFDGSEVDGWDYSIGSSIKSSPAIVDLDDDAMAEIIVSDFSGGLHIVGNDSPDSFTIFVPLVTK